MQTIYVKFLTEPDRARGFLELARHSGISSLPGHVYQVSRDALTRLDELHIGYRRATDSEVTDAHDQVRNPTTAVL